MEGAEIIRPFLLVRQRSAHGFVMLVCTNNVLLIFYILYTVLVKFALGVFMVPIKALMLASLPALVVLGAEAGDRPLDDDDQRHVVFAADRNDYQRYSARTRLGGRALPEHDRLSTGRVGSKVVRLPSDVRPFRYDMPRATQGDRRNRSTVDPYARRYNGIERRREERGPIERDRLNIEAQRKVSRGPA